MKKTKTQMTMKKIIRTNLILVMVLSTILMACDENEIMPAYQKKGTGTATVATITASNTSPVAGQTITLTLNFVNPASDPIATVQLRARVGSGSFSEIQSFDEQSAPTDAEVSHEVNYVTPPTPGTVTFEMVITSKKEYPQVRRTAVTVK
jgi:hypothetical protein